MKRSRRVTLHHFRKSLDAFPLAPVALAISALLLTGCDSNNDYQTGSSSSSQPVVVGIFKNAEECTAQFPSEAQACQQAYNNAVTEAKRTAPRYVSYEDCVADFGQGVCVAENEVSASSNSSATYASTAGENTTDTSKSTTNTHASTGSGHSSFIIPALAGYMMGRASGQFNSANSQPLFSSKQPSSPAYNRMVDTAGNNYGNNQTGRFTSAPASALQAKPAAQGISRRGGFGSTVAAAESRNNQLRSSMRPSNSSASRPARSYGG